MIKETGKNERRIIFHVDVNSAFLSWSAAARLKDDPAALDLRTVPSAVAGDIETRHGIITAKSIPAKKYGVKTAETVGSALKKCPQLILVKSDFKTYREYSGKFIGKLHEYSEIVEQASIDEAYVDMTKPVLKLAGESHGKSDNSQSDDKHETSRGFYDAGRAAFIKNADTRNAAYEIAAKIKDEIRDTLGFTVNVGISENKLLAKTASDFEKPDKIHTLWPDEVPEKLWPMPISGLFGCGAATAAKLNSIGIRTIGDAAHTSEKVLKNLLGEKGGEYIFEASNGRGSSFVRSEAEEAKGYSNELTTAEDIGRDNYEKLGAPMVREIAEKVAARLQRDGVYAGTIGVMVKTDTFRRRSRQVTLEDSTNRTEVIVGTAGRLMRDFLEEPGGIFDQGRKVRLIGVSASKIDHGEYRQMSLFDLDGSTAVGKKNKPEENKKPDRQKNEERKADSGIKGEEKKANGEKIKSIRENGPGKKETVDDAISENDKSSDEPENREKRLNDMMQVVRRKYGEGAITRGIKSILTDQEGKESKNGNSKSDI